MNAAISTSFRQHSPEKKMPDGAKDLYPTVQDFLNYLRESSWMDEFLKYQKLQRNLDTMTGKEYYDALKKIDFIK